MFTIWCIDNNQDIPAEPTCSDQAEIFMSGGVPLARDGEGPRELLGGGDHDGDCCTSAFYSFKSNNQYVLPTAITTLDYCLWCGFGLLDIMANTR